MKKIKLMYKQNKRFERWLKKYLQKQIEDTKKAQFVFITRRTIDDIICKFEEQEDVKIALWMYSCVMR